MELAVNAKPYRMLDLSASYTFTNAVNRSVFCSRLPANIRATASLVHCSPRNRSPGDWMWFSTCSPTAAISFPFSSRAFKFAGPVKADLGLSYRADGRPVSICGFTGKWKTFDREYFESGFRTPGAVFTGGMGLRF